MAVRGYIVLLRPFFTIAGWEILGRMRWTTGKIIGAIVSTLMVVAAILTIIDTPLGWWNRFGSGGDTKGSVATNQLVLPALSTVPTLTPTQVPSLENMLEAAKSLNAYSERDRALRIVAETAVEKGNYDVAIKAGTASPTYDASSKTLAFVALCAAREGLFELAMEAADKIPTYSVQDSTKIEVLSIKSVQEISESIQASGAPSSPGCRSGSPP